MLFDRLGGLPVSIHRNADAILDAEAGFLSHHLDLVDQMTRQGLPPEARRHCGIEREDHVSVGGGREAVSALHHELQISPPEADLGVAHREGNVAGGEQGVANDSTGARGEGGAEGGHGIRR